MNSEPETASSLESLQTDVWKNCLDQPPTPMALISSTIDDGGLDWSILDVEDPVWLTIDQCNDQKSQTSQILS